MSRKRTRQRTSAEKAALNFDGRLLAELERRGLKLRELYSGIGASERTVGRWLDRDDTAWPTVEDALALAQFLALPPSEVFVWLGWLDETSIGFALRVQDALDAVARGLTSVDDRAGRAPGAASRLLGSVEAAGTWNAVLLTEHKPLGGPTDASVHFVDHLGLTPHRAIAHSDLREAVLREFETEIRLTAAMPEDDPKIRRELSDDHPGVGLWLRIPRLMAERGPSLDAEEPLRSPSIAVIGSHWGGQDDVAALLASSLGWGHLNTSFAAATLFGRDMRLATRRDREQALHNANAAWIARTLIRNVASCAERRAWAHGTPGSLADVAFELSRSPGTEMVVFLRPHASVPAYAERVTADRPDRVTARVMTAEVDEASAHLETRRDAGTAIFIDGDVGALADEPFPYFVSLFVDTYRRLEQAGAVPGASDLRNTAMRSVLA